MQFRRWNCCSNPDRATGGIEEYKTFTAIGGGIQSQICTGRGTTTQYLARGAASEHRILSVIIIAKSRESSVIGHTDISCALPAIARSPFENVAVSAFCTIRHIGKILGRGTVDFAYVHTANVVVHNCAIYDFRTRHAAVF